MKKKRDDVFCGGGNTNGKMKREGENNFKKGNKKMVWLHNGMANGKMFVRQMMSCNNGESSSSRCHQHSHQVVLQCSTSAQH